MRAAFAGTPQAAVPALRALTEIADVDLVITRPDAPRGRSRRPKPPPIKEAADQLGHEVAQPARSGELEPLLADRTFDVGVVVAFGMILPAEVLALPKHGFVNVHFSLLPRWRGAAPVQRALMEGDRRTGVTLMLMDAGLDTGPVLVQEQTLIGEDDTGASLEGRLAEIGADLLVSHLASWVEGKITPRPQPEEGVTYAHRLEPADRALDHGTTATRALNQVRALSPLIGARLDVAGEPHKILAARPHVCHLKPGEWAEVEGRPVVGFADGALEVITIQPPGKRPMPGADWLRGRPLPH